jgi:hypothetical protein
MPPPIGVRRGRHHPVCGTVNDIYWFAVCAASVMSVPPWPSAAVTKLVECGRRALKALAVPRELGLRLWEEEQRYVGNRGKGGNARLALETTLMTNAAISEGQNRALQRTPDITSVCAAMDLMGGQI